jgi:dipeptidyl aminopeptidase/acylaminoacyl peptidase
MSKAILAALLAGAVAPAGLAVRAEPRAVFAGCGPAVTGRDPDWSRANGRIAYVRGDRSYSLWTMRADGSGQRRLTRDRRTRLRGPRWFPDGRQVLVADYANRWVQRYRVDGSQGRFVATGIAAAPAPDGARVAVARGSLDVVNIADSRARRIVDEADAAFAAPDWSPDGSTIVFVGELPVNHERALELVHADGTGLHALEPAADLGESHADGLEPRWSRDGSRIAYTLLRRDGPEEIHVVRPDGAGDRILVRDRVDATSAAWSPSGSRLVYVRGAPADSPGSLWIVDVDGRGRHPVARGCLFGTGHADVLRSRAQRPIYGLEGDDRILARDGRRERIGCGPGRDRVVADRNDALARDCERVSRG